MNLKFETKMVVVCGENVSNLTALNSHSGAGIKFNRSENLVAKQIAC